MLSDSQTVRLQLKNEIGKMRENLEVMKLKQDESSFYRCMEADSQLNEEPMETFFKGVTLPRSSESQKSDLDCPITGEEIMGVIKGLPSGKPPGPDGFTADFFKCYVSELTPLLLSMYNEAFVKGELPDTLAKALITLILKKYKDPCDCKSYRPISLIPLDTKILSKVLANRLEKLYISEDCKVLSTFPHPLKYWAQTAIMIGRQTILRNWKKPGEPPVQEWVTELGSHEVIPLSYGVCYKYMVNYAN
ncbi:hypothetical protein F2P81_018420 [Scophthalmus maximus]|uniref:Reverse transcriptase domain-containing protein n=1 Tax=Scophthalmus maximus TaxID=52904 RepID=A0A6A4SAC5_SCOMX|nr:hypothetical protein F2P81_018420 [Scophthalmus maximus]